MDAIKERLEKATADGDLAGLRSALQDAKANGGNPQEIQKALDEVERLVQSNRTADEEGAAAVDEAAETRSRAEAHKKRGNERLKENTKSAARDALACFTSGLDVHCTDRVLNAQLHSNRAHVRMLLRQFVEAVDDSRKAIEFDPANVKAYWRGAKASWHLDLCKNAIEFCERGLEQAPNDAELTKLRNTCAEKLAGQQQRRAELAAVSQADFNADEAVAVQEKVNSLAEQVETLRATIGSKDQQRLKAGLTLATLQDTPADVRLYGSVGRIFIAQDRSEITQALNETVQNAEEEIPKLKKAYEELDKRKQGAEAEFREMISALKRQGADRSAAGAA